MQLTGHLCFVLSIYTRIPHGQLQLITPYPWSTFMLYITCRLRQIDSDHIYIAPRARNSSRADPAVGMVDDWLARTTEVYTVYI